MNTKDNLTTSAVTMFIVILLHTLGCFEGRERAPFFLWEIYVVCEIND